MSQSKKETITERRKRLNNENHQIEKKYSNKISLASKSVHSALTPLKTIRKNPMKAVGIALLIGFTISYTGKKNSRKSPGSSRIKFSSLLMDELKRVGARRAITLLSDVVDREVLPRIISDREINRTENNN